MMLQLSFSTLSPWTGRAAGRQAFPCSGGLDHIGFSRLDSPATYCKVTEITESALTFKHGLNQRLGESSLTRGLFPRDITCSFQNTKQGQISQLPRCSTFVAYHWIKEMSLWRILPFIMAPTEYQGCQNSVFWCRYSIQKPAG